MRPDSSVFSPLQKLRVVALTLGGSAFSAAVIVVVPIVTIHMVRGGDVQRVGDIAPELIFFVLAGVLLSVVGRAWLRVRRGGDDGDRFLSGLAKATPFAAAAGVIGGVMFAFSVVSQHDAGRAGLGRMTCRDALGWEASDAAVAACEPVGVKCNRLQREKVRREHLGASTLRGAEAPEAVCTREALGGGGR